MTTSHKPSPRAFPDLANLRDAELFSEVAAGLSAVHDHVAELERCVQGAADAKLSRLVRLGSISLREEAAKYLILLDAIRCPRAVLPAHFNKFRRFAHVARAVYADVCEWHVVNFVELRGHIERDLRAFYLDGPHDVDWIFPNSLNAEREQALYVDYYRTDDGGHFWHSPLHLDETIGGLGRVPTVARLVKALHAAGVGAPEALAHVAATWRGVAVRDEMHHNELYSLNHQTLVTLDEKGVLAARPHETYHEILDRWSFPLHSIDLALRDVDLKKLHEERGAWCEDPGYYG